MKNEVTLMATAAMGLEALVAREVRELGYEPKTENGRVYFKAPISAIPRANLWLRVADRVRLVVGEFNATTFDDLFEKTKELRWEDFIPADGMFPVSGKSVKSGLYSVPDCQAIVKKAIVERLRQKHGIANRMPETGELYKAEVSILKDKVTLTLDTSGVGLHKRGYRIDQGEAPLKETMAAALIKLTNWKPSDPFIDPFCGSGTIPIEAAMIAQNIAPGFNRTFDSDNWGFISSEHWKTALQEVEDSANYDQAVEIIGSDIDHKSIEISKENAIEAGLGNLIEWKQMQISDLTIQGESGYIVTNPPYGERLSDELEVAKIYDDFGLVMKEHPSWSVYIFSAFEHFEEVYGRQATKRRKLFNGFIETHYYQYFGRRPKN